MSGTTRCLAVVGILVLGLLLSGTAFAFSADDFLPPAQGGSTAVVGEVGEEDDGVVRAETAQDGMNYSSQSLRELGGGFRQVEFGSGMGYIAAASEGYELFENVTASQLNKRLAYVKAYTKAKAELALGLRGLTSVGQERLTEALDAVDTASESLYNTQSIYTEDIAQATEALLRGYVVYEVTDDVENQVVHVSIATSPKTIAAVSNVSGAVVQSASLRDGLDYVLDEVTQGIVPPMGGKIVTVPATNEIAVVSFGSEIIRQHDNPSVARNLMQASQRAARVRAQDAMIGLIEGDEVSWTVGMRSATEQSYQEFETVLDETTDTVQYEVLDNVKNTFLNTVQTTNEYESFRAGQLPPGVRVDYDTDEYWVYAVAVYIPSLSQQTADFYHQMQDGPAQPKGNTTLSDTYQPNAGDNIQQGPTGKVSSSDEL